MKTRNRYAMIPAALLGAMAAIFMPPAREPIDPEPVEPEDPRAIKDREGLITHQYPSRHEKRRYFAKLRRKHPGLRLNRRLAPATGPGSINVESEMQQMIRAGNDKGAYELYQAHHQVQCLGHGNPCSKLKPWTHTWAAQYKRAA